MLSPLGINNKNITTTLNVLRKLKPKLKQKFRTSHIVYQVR